MISASQLYDLVHCPRRVALDALGDQSLRDEPNAFIALLWEQGLSHEREVASKLRLSADLKAIEDGNREQETLSAMRRGEPLIYGGRIAFGDLVGEPDLLELRGAGYIPVDIKAGSGFEGDSDEGKLKKHYAYQLAHYIHILRQLGFSDGSFEGAVLDRNAERIPYVLTEPQGPRKPETWWDSYLQALEFVRRILAQEDEPRGALCAACKLCHWHSHCKRELVVSDDLTLIAELGRTRRDAMFDAVPTVRALAEAEVEQFVTGKKTAFSGIGPDTLRKFKERAVHLVTPNAAPYLKGVVNLPISEKEVYFDIEADPMRDIIYLHGFVERVHGCPETAQFINYFSDSSDAMHEEEVFRRAWCYLSQRVLDSTVYYYSKYERTAYKKLASKFPDVCSLAEVETLFALPAMVDLYEVVLKGTEWPLNDRSIKTLAQHLGFQWRDTHPSGAASIEWYHRWTESGDPLIKQRILDYNEDDCLATGIVVDGIRAMQ